MDSIAKSQLDRPMKILSAAMVFLLLGVAFAAAQTPKELRTKKGVPVALVNLLSTKPGCSSSPGPVAVPLVKDKPANGTVQMMIVAVDMAASGNCQARKVPSITLLYVPKEGFTGTDAVGIEIEIGNRTTILSYHIAVGAAGESL
jgi:hypothetical protein